MEDIVFIHAADVHLGRPFSGLERLNPELGSLFRRAEVDAWNRLVLTAVQRRVSFVVLAGDVLDSQCPTIRARLALRDGLTRLHEARIPVFLALGNHDPLMTFPDALQRLEGLHVFGAEPQGTRAQLEEITEGLAIYGASFLRSSVRENLAARFRRDSGVQLAIGVLHANVSGSKGHADYAPCTLDDLKAAGMDVWCLGHVHAPSVLWQDPLIAYSGVSQGAHVNESGPRGCYLVTVNNAGRALTEFVPLAPVLWAPVDVDVTHIETVDDLMAAVEATCSDLVSGDGSVEVVVARIDLRGFPMSRMVPMAATDREWSDVLDQRLRSLTVPVFLESVRDRTVPRFHLNALEMEDGFLADFIKVCRETGSHATSADRIFREVHRELLRHVSQSYLPSELLFRSAYRNSGPWKDLFDEATSQVARTFLESRDSRTD